MSGIYIPGAAMPEMCQECIFDVCAICELTNEKNNLVEIGKRRSDCPLISVPPHGRLIDANALMQHEVFLSMDGGHLPVVYASYVRHAPTIIQADKEAET